MDLLCNAMDMQELREKRNLYIWICKSAVVETIQMAIRMSTEHADAVTASHPDDYIKGDRQTLETTVGA